MTHNCIHNFHSSSTPSAADLGGSFISHPGSSSTRSAVDSLSCSDLEVLSSSRERLKKEKIDNALTANQLQFDRLRGLCGRSREIAILKECLSRILVGGKENDDESTTTSSSNSSSNGEETTRTGGNETIEFIENGDKSTQPDESSTSQNGHPHPSRKKQKQLVLIRGQSGTGKSVLALELKAPAEAAGGIFCTGKYDLNHSQPFVGIAAACKEICQRILKLQESSAITFQSIQEQLTTKLGEANIDLLANVVVQIQDIATATKPTQHINHQHQPRQDKEETENKGK